MTISGFSVTPAFVAPGESIHVEFTISVTSSDTVNGLHVYAGNGGSFVIYSDDSFTLSAGKSKKISFDAVISKDNYYINKNMGDNRYIVDPVWAIVLGYYGSRKEVSNPITYLNMRYTPKIESFAMKRAIDGEFNDEGVHVITTLKLGIAPEADISDVSLRLYYAEGTLPTTASSYFDLTSLIPNLLTGVVDSTEILQNSFSNGIDWYFLLVFGDNWEQTPARASLPRAFANLHLSGQPNGGACFGGFSSSTKDVPKLESYFPAYFYAGINGVTNYSDKEVKTGGTWIDGKPIYRKVIVANAGSASAIATIDTIANFASLVRVYGSAKRSSTNTWYNIPTYGSDSVWNDVYVTAEGSVRARSSFGNEATFYVAVEYTKTN